MQFNDLGKQWNEIRDVCLKRVDELGKSGAYIGGKEVEDFEKQFANYVGTVDAVGVSNGTDGLKLALQALDLDERDTVIMPANTFIADYIAVKQLPQKSKPTVVLVDHDDNFCIDVESLRKYYYAHNGVGRIVVIAVHLYGHSCDMTALSRLKEEKGFILIEDCSQAHGTKFFYDSDTINVGTIGDMSIFSLYPGKNLGALGDAGIITTSNSKHAEKLRSLRNYGSSKKYYYDYIGHNNRLDPLQCIFLSEKLRRLDIWNSMKRRIATRYLKEIRNPNVILPKVSCIHSFHVFCIMVNERESFMKRMNDAGIPTLIHYPIPIHKTSVWEKSDIVFNSDRADSCMDRIVSIPIHPFLSEDDVTLIVKMINQA